MFTGSGAKEGLGGESRGVCCSSECAEADERCSLDAMDRVQSAEVWAIGAMSPLLSKRASILRPAEVAVLRRLFGDGGGNRADCCAAVIPDGMLPGRKFRGNVSIFCEPIVVGDPGCIQQLLLFEVVFRSGVNGRLCGDSTMTAGDTGLGGCMMSLDMAKALAAQTPDDSIRRKRYIPGTLFSTVLEPPEGERDC